MSGTTPPPGSEPGDEQNPYAQPGDAQPPQERPWPGGEPPASPPPPVQPPGEQPGQQPGQPPAWNAPPAEQTPAWGPGGGYPGGYPAGAYPGGDFLADAPERPRPLRTAVILMYVGAVVSGLYALLILVAGDSIRDALRDSFEDADTGTSEVDIDSMVDGTFAVIVGLFVVAVVLWVWMAWANNRGRSWARVVATILGVLGILFMLLNLTAGGLNTVIALVWILLAGSILFLLYRSETSEYYAAVSRMRQR